MSIATKKCDSQLDRPSALKMVAQDSLCVHLLRDVLMSSRLLRLRSGLSSVSFALLLLARVIGGFSVNKKHDKQPQPTMTALRSKQASRIDGRLDNPCSKTVEKTERLLTREGQPRSERIYTDLRKLKSFRRILTT